MGAAVMSFRPATGRVLLLLATFGAAPAGAQAPNPVPGQIASDEGGAPGFQQGPERSRFALGGATHEVQEYGFAKLVGPNGVFSTNLHNGMVIALPNANAPVAAAPPGYAPDPDRHSSAVLQYFREAGLPKDQIGGMHVLTRLSLSGRTGERAGSPSVDGYTSVIERQVEGIPVPDSFAAAQLDPQGQVTAEWVYWPAIPASVIATAKQLRTALTGPGPQQSFLARLPSYLPPGQVVIRHASGTVTGPFQAFASYDVLARLESGGGTGLPGYPAPPPRVVTAVRHFGIDGVEFRLPQETRASPAQTPMPPAR
jgi:hypothetical protein